MSKYKLVPVKPTREMWAAAGDAVVALNSHHHDAISEAVYKAMLAAAPAVQGEPVAYAVFADNGNIRIWSADPIQTETLRLEYGDQVRPLYAAQQPAERHPECGCCGQTDRCDDDCDAVVIGGHRGAAEQQPDVALLVGALELFVSNPTPTSEDFDMARTALAAYRKQGGEA